MKVKLHKTVAVGQTSARNRWQFFVVVVLIVDFEFNYLQHTEIVNKGKSIKD